MAKTTGLLTAILVCQIPSLVSAQQQQNAPVFVTAPQGQFQGFHVDYSTFGWNYRGSGDIFLGIPFAQPPVKNLRFKRPASLPTLNQAGVWNATYYRPACPQYSPQEMSEDCLYLNVMTPSVNTTTPFPVMFWVHGGALTTGSAKDFHYQGAVRNLVSRGVVVVTIQYRLGLIGYFTTFTDDFPPNRGSLDQVEALKWVQRNIAAFGGDPTKVTVFGQSAGGCSVSALSLSPLTVGLFNNVIAESGTVLTCFEGGFGYVNENKRRAVALCNVTDTEWCSGNTTRLAQCLSTRNYIDFLAADITDQKTVVVGWRMVQDDYFMPYVPADGALKSSGNRSFLLGNNRDEWAFWEMWEKVAGFSDESYSRDYLVNLFEGYWGTTGPRVNDVINLLIDTYTPNDVFSNGDNFTVWQQITSDVMTSSFFTGFIVREVVEHLQAGHNNVYLYEFTYPTQLGRPINLTGWMPIPHTAELTYVWFDPPIWVNNTGITRIDLQLADFFGTAWTNFAKTGNPGGNWPTAGNNFDNLAYMEIGATQNVRSAYRDKDNLLWRRILPTLIGFYPPSKPDRDNGPCTPTSMSYTGLPIPA